MEGNSIGSTRRKGMKRSIDESQNFEDHFTSENHNTSDPEEDEACAAENGENYDDRTETYSNEDHQYLAQSESTLKTTRNEKTNLIICSPDESLETYKSTWTRSMTQMLIEEYGKMVDDFRNPHKKQKDLWFDLANNMCRRGCEVTWDMCDRKWRNLKHTFKTIYFSRHRSLNSKRRWEFYSDLEEFFVPQGNDEMLRTCRSMSPIFDEGSDPSTARETVMLKTTKIPRLSNSSTSPVAYAQILDVSSVQDTAMYPEIILCDGKDVDKKSAAGCSSRTSNSESAPSWFLELLQQQRKDEENRLAVFREMHSELIQVEKRKCAILEGILRKLI